MKSVNVGIIWANPNATNLGVSALAYSTLILLDNIFKNKKIIPNYYFVGGTKRGYGKIIVNDDEISFTTLVGTNYFRFKSLILFVLKPYRYGLSVLRKLDYVFDISGGDSFTDIYGQQRFKQMLNSKKMFNFLGNKQFILPQTIGPFTSKANEKKAFGVLKKIKTPIFCRDVESYQYCLNNLNYNKIEEIIDVAFLLPYQKSRPNEGIIQIGFNVSGLLWNGGYTRNNQFNLLTNYKKLVQMILEFFSKMKGVKVHLIAHVIHDDCTKIEDDYSILKQIHLEYNSFLLAPAFRNPIEAKSYISNLDFFIGSRMHACIAALSSNVPVYPLAYSRKFSGLFKNTLNYCWMGDLVTQNEDQLFNDIIRAFFERDNISVKIVEINNSIVKPRVKKLIEMISENL